MSTVPRLRSRWLQAGAAVALTCAVAASPANAAATQVIDTTVRLSCPIPDFGGNTWRGSALELRIQGTAPTVTSPGTTFRPDITSATVRLLDGSASNETTFLTGGLDRLSFSLRGGTTIGSLDFSPNDLPFPRTPKTSGGWGPITVPVSEAYASSLGRTDTTEPTTLQLGGLALDVAITPQLPDSGSFDSSPRTCRPSAADAVIAVIANDPSAPPAPSISEVTPSTGSVLGGTPVTIRGANFDRGTTPEVMFGGQAATNVVVVDDATLTAVTPPTDFFGTARVTVKADGRTNLDTVSNRFEYSSPDLAPQITSITPSSGPVGSIVTVKGRNLDQLYSMEFGFVYLGPPELPGTATEFQFRIPETGPGRVDLLATNRFGFSENTAGDDFTVTVLAPLPTVTQLAPNTAPANRSALHFIRGTRLASVRVIQVGTKRVAPIANLSGTLLFVSPPQPAGTYPVTLVTKDGRSAPTGRTITYR